MKTLRSIVSIFLVILFIPTPTMWARDILRMAGGGSAGSGAGGAGSSAGGGATGGTQNPGREQASARANDRLIRTAGAIDAVRRMQEAARNNAHNGGNNLGFNPNNPSQPLPDVPNGIGAGGLQAANGVNVNPDLWQGAQGPTQHQDGGKTVVTVKQEASQALLTWQSFNVGKDTVLHFDQSAGGADRGNWTAFNKVADPSAAPSQILGQIKAEGQVYIINPNGVIFGGGSQVDVRSLTVSTLPINTHLVQNGILNNPDSQFLFSALEQAAGTNGTPAFVPDAPPAALGRYGDVLVMAGAQLNSTLSADGSGGRIMLVGPNVENRGTIRTPGGQTILAAGLQVGVAAHASSDASLRGLDVYIGAIAPTASATPYAGRAVNSGLIEAARGNVTLAGAEVVLARQQMQIDGVNYAAAGVIESSTSVALNGRVDLLASYDAVSNPLDSANTGEQAHTPFLNRQSGSVTLEDGSLIRILPELESKDKVAASELALRSQVNMRGRTIYLGKDASVLAPGGIVNADAGVWQYRRSGAVYASDFVNAGGQIYLDTNALVSVAGTTDVIVPLSQVILTLDLRGSELADSPVQRDDVLRGETITVDIRKRGTLDGVDWVGSPIADVSGYLGLVERTVGELTSAGGDVNFNAGGSVVMQNGSEVDVSGGWVQYEGGTVETTRLIKDGRLIDIADARADVTYDGIYKPYSTVEVPRWGYTEHHAHTLAPKGSSHEVTYTAGTAGGNLTMTAVSMALDGALRGSTVTGDRQQTASADHATLTLAFETRDLTISADRFPVIAPGAPTVVFANDAGNPSAVGPFAVAADGSPLALPQERSDTVTLSAGLLGNDGFGNVTVRNREGDVRVGSDVALTGQRGGALTLQGANVLVDGDITIAGGTIDLSAYNISYDTVNRLELLPNPTNPPVVAGRGKVVIGSDATLSTAGMIVDTRPGMSGSNLATYATDGGKISLRGFDTHLEQGSVVDVSGGVFVAANGGVSYGRGGSIDIQGGRDLSLGSVLGGSVKLGGELKGYSGSRGGTLSLLAPVVEIGGTGTHADATVLAPEFFNEGGFGNFNIRGIGAKAAGNDNYVPGVTIVSGTTLHPQVKRSLATVSSDGVSVQNLLLAQGVREAGSLSFGAVGASNPYANMVLVRGEVLLQQGATVQTDAGGSVAFDANAVALHGTVITPGGKISVRGGSQLNAQSPASDRAMPTVLIGQSACLFANGTTVLVDNPQGIRSGTVYSGGSIDVSGNIVAAQGAVLDVSGTSGVLDLPSRYVAGGAVANGGVSPREYTAVTIDTAGGSIALNGGGLLRTDATLLGNAGGADAAGGTLKVSSGRFYTDGETSTTADVALNIVQSGQTMASGDAPGIGQNLYDENGNLIRSGGRFAIDRFAQGGFDNLELAGNVGVDSAVQIDARGSVRLASGGVLKSNGHDLSVKAGHVAIGQDFKAPKDPSQPQYLFTQNIPGVGEQEYRFVPKYGEGKLRVDADLIDIGTLSFDGIGNAEFVAAAGGAIRGNGSVNIAGEMVLEGGMIHPTTADSFTLSAFDYTRGGVQRDGVITFRGGNPALALPYSAGGTLSAYASQINQQGVLRAPFGVINLGWDGSGTAPVNAISGTAAAVSKSVVLAGGSVTSVSGVGADGKGISLPYGIVRNGISWIDPRGIDITQGGLPEKQVNLAAQNLTTEDGSVIDLRGGGDLFAYRWVPGVGGTQDVLASGGSFAIVPGYSAAAAYAPYNPSPVSDTLGGDKGYVNDSLKVGDQVYLSAQSGLPAGVYTLLPARYALMEGAYLLTPKGSNPVGASAAVSQADGSHLVSGYRMDGNSGAIANGKVLSLFEVASSKVVHSRSQYDMFSANKFMSDAAADRGVSAPRLPQDSGQAVFSASSQMNLDGSLRAAAVGGGRGSLVDINSALDIVISSGGGNTVPGALNLDVDTLNAFSAASLLVGGVRSSAEDGMQVRVSSGTVTVENTASPLKGADIILVGNDGVHVADGARIESVGSADSAGVAGRIYLGSSDVVGSGNGALVRVSHDGGAAVERRGVTSGSTAQLTVGQGANISGNSLVLDSSAGTVIDAQAQISANELTLGSGRISLVLDESAGTPGGDGLVLSDAALSSILASAKSIGFSSYSSLDVYGSGTVGSADVQQLAFNAPVLRAHGGNGGEVVFTADNILLQNTTGTTAGTLSPSANGNTLVLDAKTVSLGKGGSAVEGFETTRLRAAEQVRLTGVGSLNIGGNLAMLSPRLMAERASAYTLDAAGDVRFDRLPATTAGEGQSPVSGLGASVAINGASLAVNSDIVLPSGKIELKARDGDLRIGDSAAASLDAAGRTQTFYDRTAHSDAGSVSLVAEKGSVVIGSQGVVDVSAAGGDSKAGTLSVSAVRSGLVLDGELRGSGASGGNFSLDVQTLRRAGDGVAVESLAAVDAALNSGGFSGERAYRLRSGNVVVDGAASAASYSVSADDGSVRVTGTVDASGKTGGQIALRAADDVVLENGAVLSVAGDSFSSAGKGGKIFLEAGSQIDGAVNRDARVVIGSGSLLDLSVAERTADSAAQGKFSGVLHLRAAQNAAGTDMGIAAIDGEVRGASHIAAEGYSLFDLTDSGGTITTAVQNAIRQNGTNFLGASGTESANYRAMLERISGGNAELAQQLILQTGAEVINRNGNLTLGSTSSTESADWNLASNRFGARGSAGVLTLRAAGDIVLYNALSDGFSGGTSLWLSPLTAQNANLPANAQSWSYRLSAGADTGAADYTRVLGQGELAAGKGSLLLGKDAGAATASGGNSAQTSSVIANRFQVIRTGSGDIDINLGKDLKLLNPFASIYTAGTAVQTPTTLYAPNDFLLPILRNTGPALSQGSLGTLQQNYPVQYSMAGGDVRINASGDMGRYTRNAIGTEIADSSRQLPNNWLYRRGYVDGSGQYGSIYVRGNLPHINVTDSDASTTWWVDFSNFFQGVGALGGGNVSLLSGGDIMNIDAVIPTNARAPKGAPDASKLIELGGGDLLVSAGRNIDGGVYYVERGTGTLEAGNAITTNATRSINRGIVESLSNPKVEPQETWMPTTLFLGKGQFDVSATGDVLLGPVANTFLLPQGVGNRYWYKTYFSTYSPDSAVSVSSDAGSVTLRNEVTMADSASAQSFLQTWLDRQQLLAGRGSNNASFSQPWLRLAETSIDPFATMLTVMPASLAITSFSSDVHLTGTFNLFPSPTGTIEVLSAGNIHALNPNGISAGRIVAGETLNAWKSSWLNLSDANPALLPGVANPFSYYNAGATSDGVNNTTRSNFLQNVNRFFAETGATNSVLQTQQALHASQPLHRNDSEPVRLYAAGGDISGLTLYSAKPARIFASQDIADIGFYLQNLNAEQVSVVAAGRDIVAYHANSERRLQAQQKGNAFNSGQSEALSGDIQLSGPGTLQVLAGRNLDLGVGPGGSDGTFSGVTTVGNRRNPFLPDQGADIIAGAGIGMAQQLGSSKLDFDAFITAFLDPASGGELATRYLKELGKLMGLAEGADAWQAFAALGENARTELALGVFYLVLRDAGRDYNNPEAETFGSYKNGFEAIKLLFPGSDNDPVEDGKPRPQSPWSGDISLTARQFKTSAGGAINLFAPGGNLVVGFPVANSRADQGILTEAGGAINIFTDGNVDVGSSRIFTLRGGDEVIWSSKGDIAAGSAAKTVRSAPPTRVIIDSQTASVQTDLSGLATGGGIGVLQTVKGVPEGSIDLIAPSGSVDAGDAGIRAGNLNIAAVEVINAGNIQVSGSSAGVPSMAVAMPNIAGLSAASSSTQAAAGGMAGMSGGGDARSSAARDGIPSVISIEVLGFGEDYDEDKEA